MGKILKHNNKILKLNNSIIKNGINGCIYSIPGDYTWIVPIGVTSIKVKCYGGGGKGGPAIYSTGSTTYFHGCGGGGGGYAEKTFNSLFETGYTVHVADASPQDYDGTTNTLYSWVIDYTQVKAMNGGSAQDYDVEFHKGLGGGTLGPNIGDIIISGGSGSWWHFLSNGGGGGGCAGRNGYDATTTALGGTGSIDIRPYGGNGGMGTGGSHKGLSPGGGSGGNYLISDTESGGTGLVILEYNPPISSFIIVTYSTPGDYIWIVPVGVTSIKVKCYGGGGRGNSAEWNPSGYSNYQTGGGGGGGGYAEKIFNSLSETGYTVHVADASPQDYDGSTNTLYSWAIDSSQVKAMNGGSAYDTTEYRYRPGEGGGTLGSNIGDIIISGGNGGEGSHEVFFCANGGGGGGCAGTNGNDANDTALGGIGNVTITPHGGDGGSGVGGSYAGDSPGGGSSGNEVETETELGGTGCVVIEYTLL